MGVQFGTMGTLLFDGRIILKSPHGSYFFDEDGPVNFYHPHEDTFDAVTDPETGETYDESPYARHPQTGKPVEGALHAIEGLNQMVKKVIQLANEEGKALEVNPESSVDVINKAIEMFNARHRQGERPLPLYDSPAWRRTFVNGHGFQRNAKGLNLFDKDDNLLTYFPAWGGKNQGAIESGIIPFAEELRETLSKDYGISRGLARSALGQNKGADFFNENSEKAGIHIRPQFGMSQHVYTTTDEEQGKEDMSEGILERYYGPKIPVEDKAYGEHSLTIENFVHHLPLGMAAPTSSKQGKTRGRKSTTEKHSLEIYRDMLEHVDESTPLPQHFKDVARENEQDFNTIGDLKTALEGAIGADDSAKEGLVNTLRDTFGSSELGKVFHRLNKTDTDKDRIHNATLVTGGPGQRLMASMVEQARQREDLLHGITEDDIESLGTHFKNFPNQIKNLVMVASAAGTHESGVSNMKYMETGHAPHDDWVNDNQEDAEAYHNIYSQMGGQSAYPFSGEASGKMVHIPESTSYPSYTYNTEMQAPQPPEHMKERWDAPDAQKAVVFGDPTQLGGQPPVGQPPLPADAPPGMAPETPADPYARPPRFRMPSTTLPSAETMVDPRLAAMRSMAGRIQANRPTYAGDPTGGFYERVVPQRGYKVVPPGYKVVPQAPRRGFLQFLQGRRR